MKPGAKGVEQVSDNLLVCYVDVSDGTSLDEFVKAAEANGFEHVETKEVADENWTAKCEELLTPIEVGKFTVTPVISADSAATRKSSEIFIIPGTGFGTGHHAATRLALKCMQNVKSNPGIVLDLGTGSGILAIAAALLWPSAGVHAVDNDTLALVNTIQNVELNQLKDKIKLVEGTIEELTDPYHLIIANIYAEVLCDLEAAFYRALHEGGELILSGISER